MFMLKKLHTEESGIVSLIVTVMIMIVISLIVLNFAKLSRREERQALDRQLSTQAYYAAESGLNAGVEYVRNNPGSAAKTFGDCASVPADKNFSGDNRIISSTAKYTCVTVDPTTPDLQYDDISTNASKVIPIEAKSGTIDSLTFNWEQPNVPDQNLPNCPATGFSLPASDSWYCGPGVLRIDIFPTDKTSIKRADFATNTFTAFLYPRHPGNGSGAVVFQDGQGFSKQGIFASGDCKATYVRACKVTITNLGATGANFYMMRIKSIYNTSRVIITAQDSGSTDLIFKGAQAMIDSTGKANDVLHRLRARAALAATYTIPEFGLQSASDLCKRFYVIPPGTAKVDPSDPKNPLPPSCQIP